MVTDDALTQDIDANDEFRLSFRQKIDRLDLPAYSFARRFRVTVFALFYFLPIVALSVYLPIYIDDLLEPLDIYYTLSNIRTLLWQLVGIGFHYVCERLNLMLPPLIYGDPPPSFGSTFNSSQQVEFLVLQLSQMVPRLGSLVAFHEGNDQLEKARSYVFQDLLPFNIILNVSEGMMTTNVSLMRMMVEYMVLLTELIQTGNETDFPPDTFNSKFVATPFNNIRVVTSEITAIGDLVFDYISKNYLVLTNITMIILIVIMVFIPILYAVTCTLVIREIENEKVKIYKCLASLPKHIVSHVADVFKVMKKDDSDMELMAPGTVTVDLNKQEENALKIFATSSGGGGSGKTDSIVIILCTIILLAAYLTTVGIIVMWMDGCAQDLKESARHIDYILGWYTYDFAALTVIIMLGASFEGYNVYRFGHDRMVSSILDWHDQAANASKWVLYGDVSQGIVPFYGFKEASYTVADSANRRDVLIPESDHDCYGAWSANLLFEYVQICGQDYMAKHRLYYRNADPVLASRANFSLKDPLFDHLWHIHMVHLYDRYFVPLFESIISNISSLLRHDLSTFTIVAWILFVIGLVVEAFLLAELNASEDRQMFTLRLLLQCPASSIISNPHIMALLNGKFHEKSVDSTTRDEEFYQVVVQDLPDSIIMAKLDGIIIHVNCATERIWGFPPAEMLGQSLVSIGASFKGENVFARSNTGTGIQNFSEIVLYAPPEGSDVHLQIDQMIVNDTIVVTTRDVTSSVMYDRLICDERARSDRLLSSILPAKLVPRVQAGERNISFSVQSASIVFMDIVSFTPWCGALPAATVMKTLNLLFKEDDALVALHPTMTKIKCIGDCYMAAGGIFMDVDQPAVHAKDVVDFGLDAIAALERLNGETEHSLQIRVGVNTGGPIVAGVLGTAKPTFEILGPAINMAQQMEHHGVPMKVHVTRQVYECTYGSFVVREKGETAVKNGPPIVTYLIERRQVQADL
jgi:PAS domain S-box-containing protein